MSEHCVVCGAEIPEGRQVCPVCATVAGTIHGVVKHDLRPCPFCGGTAALEHMGWPHHVYCEMCTARVTSTKYGDEGDVEAMQRWNRRATDG